MDGSAGGPDPRPPPRPPPPLPLPLPATPLAPGGDPAAAAQIKLCHVSCKQGARSDHLEALQEANERSKPQKSKRGISTGGAKALTPTARTHTEEMNKYLCFQDLFQEGVKLFCPTRPLIKTLADLANQGQSVSPEQVIWCCKRPLIKPWQKLLTQDRLYLLNEELVHQVYTTAQIQALLYCPICPARLCTC